MLMTASASGDEDDEEGAADLLLEDDMSMDDTGDDDDAPGSPFDEPHADRLRARTGTMASRVTLRVMGCLQIGRPMRRPRSGVRRRAPPGLVVQARRQVRQPGGGR